MKPLKPWQKWIMRSTSDWLRTAITFLFALIAAGSFSTIITIHMFPIDTLSAKDLIWVTKRAHDGDVLYKIMLSECPLWWLIPSFILSLFIMCRCFALTVRSDELSEVCVKKAQDIFKNNPEFTDILNRLIQDAVLTDDGRKLAEKIQMIREIIRLKERLACKWICVASLEDEIAKKEMELRVKIE